ncbi:SET domain-containing protein-lysine N-methyltransferase [Candidatus Woesearchaeota archaeon]|nr:SET domain-containing protein-lysine N-methyltransferase [Candidatus Woesearchaeota archaeon]
MENVEVKDAGKKGKGIFALKDIKKSEQILYFTGKVVEVGNESKYPEHIREHWHPIDKKGDKTVYVLPKSPWMYMNHSCEPNARVKNDRYLIAIRDIKKGEEINIDYSTLFLEGWEMKCECGSKNCRKVISTFDKLSPKNQERLKDYVSSYVKKKYKKY